MEVYGKKAEFAAAVKNDPIPKFRALLVRKGVMKNADAKRMEEKARSEMENAVQFALASPLPAGTEAVKHVYA
jgi:pyruvate dehydrogenase E1 component alpha subunit